METETIVMTSRRRLVIKPLSPTAILQCKEQISINDNNDHVKTQPVHQIVSPGSEKKRIPIQESVLPITPTVQRNRVLLSYSADQNLSDSDDSDSDSDVSTVNEESNKKSEKSNKKLYYMIIVFLCWVVVQYWMVAVAGFGAVFFIVSALIAIYFNTTKTNEKTNILSAYSVFNPECTPIQGSADPKQLERELIFGGM